jgi:S-formylglutathione hydrolase FrmB
MPTKMKRFLLAFLFLPFLGFAQAKVDTLKVYSPSMNKSLKVAVTTPSTYQKGDLRYPTLYLLHGASGSFSDWLTKVTEPGLVTRMAEEYNLIIVTPSVGPSSYYFDSPILDSVQYDTYITSELIPEIDNKYRTLAQKESRGITGLSMGGHGSLTLSAKHPDLFAVAGSMSGVMNIDTQMWEVGEDLKTARASGFKLMLGEIDYNFPYSNNTAVGLVNQMKANGIPLIIDCGTEDFLIHTNRQIHQLLLANNTPHEYTERPGAHTWQYWTEALPVQVHFINKYLKR